jgi:hypothetical protein
MKFMRRTGFLLWLTVAMAMGQQALLLHGLAHAREKISQTQKQDAPPASPVCDQCGLYAQLSGMAPTGVPALPALSPAPVAVALDERSVPVAAPVVFLSRAPPVLL